MLEQTQAAIIAAEEEREAAEEARLAAIDWTTPDEQPNDDGNPIPVYLRDIFAKDAKPSKQGLPAVFTLVAFSQL